jgi:hypothetical protein
MAAAFLSGSVWLVVVGAVGVVLLGMLDTGLQTHHPVSTAAQLGAFAYAMRTVVSAHHGTATATALACSLALFGSFLADWSAKNDFPRMGSIMSAMTMAGVPPMWLLVAASPVGLAGQGAMAALASVSTGLVVYALRRMGPRR